MTEKFFAAVSGIAFVLLTVIGGIYIGLSQKDSSYLSRVSQGLNAAFMLQEDTPLNSRGWINLWADAPQNLNKKGVVIYNKNKAYDGYTFLIQAPEQKAYLVDMNGKIVHSWTIPLDKVLDKIQPYLKNYARDIISNKENISWRGTHLYPNGDLLFTYATATTPAGITLVKLDKDSNMIWKAPILAHHDVDVAPDGTIYTLTQKISDQPLPGYEHLGAPVIDDQVTVLSDEGKVLKNISILDAFKNSDYYSEVIPYLTNKDRCCDVNLSSAKVGDILHANTVRVITAEKAAATHHPLFKADDLLISLREFDIIAVLDPKTEKIVWALRGFWRVQHDPDITDDGHIILFDNEGDQREDPKRSRIIEIDPLTNQITWSFDGTKDETFHSLICSRTQSLPNGNVLIVSFLDGEILEVTRDKEIVWEYISPLRKFSKKHRKTYIAGLFDGHRFSRNELDFLKPSANTPRAPLQEETKNTP
ncbi:MAG: aryl-sulfate sulfotransferase [Alphaproteobacteria bacterium]|nr:aryl-sulfate sulfotransferase [Alphaproteobacteria bacterium]